jgi:hypothetical protein
LRSSTQIVLAIAILLASIRVFFIYSGRHEATNVTTSNQPLLRREMQADDYVVPSRSHAYDLESAKELVGKQVWVKDIKEWPYYRYDGRKGDLAKAAGTLTPLDHYQIDSVISQNDVRTGRGGSGPHVIAKQLLAVLKPSGNGSPLATSIGTFNQDGYSIFVNEVFYFEDPHQLYKHWPAETWAAIDRHELAVGMSALQAGFAAGAPAEVLSGDDKNSTVRFSNRGKPVEVTFVNGRITKIVPSSKPDVKTNVDVKEKTQAAQR